MKSYLKYFPLLSIGVNVYCWCVWLISFNKYSTHEDRSKFFLSYMPFNSTGLVIFGCVVLAIFSIVILLKRESVNRPTTLILQAILVVFLFLNLFQLM